MGTRGIFDEVAFWLVEVGTVKPARKKCASLWLAEPDKLVFVRRYLDYPVVTWSRHPSKVYELLKIRVLGSYVQGSLVVTSYSSKKSLVFKFRPVSTAIWQKGKVSQYFKFPVELRLVHPVWRFGQVFREAFHTVVFFKLLGLQLRELIAKRFQSKWARVQEVVWSNWELVRQLDGKYKYKHHCKFLLQPHWLIRVTGFLSAKIGRTVAFSIGVGLILVQISRETGIIRMDWGSSQGELIDQFSGAVEENINTPTIRSWINRVRIT